MLNSSTIGRLAQLASRPYVLSKVDISQVMSIIQGTPKEDETPDFAGSVVLTIDPDDDPPKLILRIEDLELE